MRVAWLALLVTSALALACDGDLVAQTDAGDAGDDRTGLSNKDSSVMFDAGMRLLPHAGITLDSMQLGIVYVGALDAGGAPDETMIDWLLASAYWGLLSEYGIGAGTLVGSARVDTSVFFQSGDIDDDAGLVDVIIVDARIAEAIHGDPDAGTGGTVSIPGAQAYLVLLPDNVNVALGHRGTYTYQTCIDANGYHGYDGFEPYAVLPPCPEGRSLYAASHELAEVATDPQPYKGWASDTDIPINGGEIADLCAQQILEDGGFVTRLWSNAANGCVP